MPTKVAGRKLGRGTGRCVEQARSAAVDDASDESVERLRRELLAQKAELDEQQQELHESHAALQTALTEYTRLFDFAPIAYFVVAADGSIRSVNLAGARLVGVGKSRLVGLGLIAYVVPSDIGRFEQLLAAVLADGGETHSAELRFRVEGNVQHLRLAGSRLPGREGERDAVLLAAEDMTHRQRVEEALRRSEQKRAAIYDHAQVAMALIRNPEGTLVEVNDAYERMFGFSRAEAVGKTAVELGLVADIDRRAQMAVEVRDRGFVRDFECGYVTRSGDHRTALFSFDLIEIDGEQFQLGTAVDITERKRAESRTRCIYDADLLGMIQWKIEGEVTDCNDRFLAMTGYTREDLRAGRINWAEMTPREWWARDELARQEIRETGAHRTYEKEWIKKDGSRVSILVGAAAFDEFRSEGISFALDITDRQRAEEAQREANERLREADQRKNDFLAMLSHELRNPLAPIRNAAYILERADPNSEQAERARGVLRRQSDHLTRLVDDLLDVTRISRGKIALQRARVSLRDVVLRATEDIRPMLAEKGIVFRVDVPAAPLWAHADETRVTQVVANLLNNASKFTRRGDEVVVSLRAEGGTAEIGVRDTGAGIEATVLPHIFEAFVQGDRTLARSEGGLGLGLALVKGIVELHGGEVRVESAGIGKGTEFIVRLPQRETADPVTTRGPASETALKGGRRVLVVDDNKDAAESLAEILRMDGHEVDVAPDGPTALEKLGSRRPEVVFCDIGLPGMNGYEVARAMRANVGWGMRLVALSGYAQPDDVKRAMEAGFNAHMAKPPDPHAIAKLLA